jgi:membrane AbrB-like protein
MGAAIAVALSGGKVEIPGTVFFLAQGLVGCLVARSITPDTFSSLARHWVFFAAMVPSASAFGLALGWHLARKRIVPGVTALWGTSPGAALLMTVMSENFGADSRLVAFMQYLRVLTVTLFAASLPLIWGVGQVLPLSSGDPEEFDAGSIVLALTLSAAGMVIGKRFNFTSGSMLFPILVLPILSFAGLPAIGLPWQLYAASYCVVGWSVGMRFTRSIVVYALRSLPRVFAAIVVMIAACGLLAWLFVASTDIDPLTAFLASCPGGMDSVAIISASMGGDVPLVMAVQTGRFIFVLLTGPALAAYLTRRMDNESAGHGRSGEDGAERFAPPGK